MGVEFRGGFTEVSVFGARLGFRAWGIVCGEVFICVRVGMTWELGLRLSFVFFRIRLTRSDIISWRWRRSWIWVIRRFRWRFIFVWLSFIIIFCGIARSFFFFIRRFVFSSSCLAFVGLIWFFSGVAGGCFGSFLVFRFEVRLGGFFFGSLFLGGLFFGKWRREVGVK